MKYTQDFYDVFFDLIDDQVVTPNYIAVYLGFGRQEAALRIDIWIGEDRIYL
jgi:hypothetical protein